MWDKVFAHIFSLVVKLRFLKILNLGHAAQHPRWGRMNQNWGCMSAGVTY